MFEVECYDESVTIWDLDNGGKLNKKEFLEKIRDDEFKPMHCIGVDLQDLNEVLNKERKNLEIVKM